MGMEDRQDSVSRGAAAGESGFSLIEVLIAAGILMVVALGVLPIFAQAIVNNRAGADYTQVTNTAKSELERLYSLPMNSPELAVTEEAGRAEYFSMAQNKWVDEAPTGYDSTLWTRTTTVRQFHVSDLADFDADADGDGQPDNALPEGTALTYVHFKEIQVQVESGRGGGPLGGGKRITLRVLKAY